MNATVRRVAGLHMRDHVTPAVRPLHWLSIKFRVWYKLCILMYVAANKLLVPVSTLPER